MWLLYQTGEVADLEGHRGIRGGRKGSQSLTRIHPWGCCTEARGVCGFLLGHIEMFRSWYLKLGNRGTAHVRVYDIVPPYSICQTNNFNPEGMKEFTACNPQARDTICANGGRIKGKFLPSLIEIRRDEVNYSLLNGTT